MLGWGKGSQRLAKGPGFPWLQPYPAPTPDDLGGRGESDHQSHPRKALSRRKDNPAFAAYSDVHQLSPRWPCSSTQRGSSVTQGSVADRHRDHATPSTESLCFPAARPALPASSPRTPSWRGSLETPFSNGAAALRQSGLVWSPGIWPLDFCSTPQKGETQARPGGTTPPLRTRASRAQRPEPQARPAGS